MMLGRHVNVTRRAGVGRCGSAAGTKAAEHEALSLRGDAACVPPTPSKDPREEESHMKENTNIEAAAPVEATAFVALAELSGEGFGWGSNYVNSPRDAVDALAAELVGRGIEVLFDDLGRRCVSRVTARELFAERAAGEQRRAEQQRRHDEELAKSAAEVPRGAPALPGASALESMLRASPPDGPKRRKSVLATALDNDGMEFFPIQEPIGEEQ
jgi:hypothetical protein